MTDPIDEFGVCHHCNGRGRCEQWARVLDRIYPDGHSEPQSGWVLAECLHCYGTGLRNRLND